MNKKLMAAAVAGALAVPGFALAQSSVTISGFFKGSFDNTRMKNTPTTSARNASSEWRVTDESSRIVFNVVEDLGGGLQAIGQVDWRVTQDAGADAAAGNNHVGLRSKSWGRIFIGRQDLHYFNRESDLTTKATLKADSISILSFAGGGGVAIAGATRTTNVIHYTSPAWGPFTIIAAYSTNPTAPEADATSVAAVGVSGVRKGNAWHLNPNARGANWQVGYSYWKSKPDLGGATVATGDQRGDRLYGSYAWGGFKVGLAWDKSKIKSSTGAAPGTTLSNRTAWSFPASYTWGAHEIHGHITRARDDKATALVRDGARMWAFAYAYSLSKRTSFAVAYSSIRNDEGAAYQHFTGTGGLGSPSTTNLAGEDSRNLSATIRHAF
ncbi:MAG: porin [Burkholderiales bacterium]